MLKCCGSTPWAQRMVDERPFRNFYQLSERANRIWWELKDEDWLEAFRSHPKIGERKAEQQTSEEASKWSEAEQSGIRDSARETLEALTELNREYHEKFGFIFIVCASGKSSEEMLSILRDRLGNDPQVELRMAAEEQAKITELRLKKLIDSL